MLLKNIFKIFISSRTEEDLEKTEKLEEIQSQVNDKSLRENLREQNY